MTYAVDWTAKAHYLPVLCPPVGTNSSKIRHPPGRPLLRWTAAVRGRMSAYLSNRVCEYCAAFRRSGDRRSPWGEVSGKQLHPFPTRFPLPSSFLTPALQVSVQLSGRRCCLQSFVSVIDTSVKAENRVISECYRAGPN